MPLSCQHPSVDRYPRRAGQKGEHDKATADFNEALRIDPDDAVAHTGRGKSWNLKGEYDAASHDLTKALQLDAANAIASAVIWQQNQLTICLWRLKEFDGSIGRTSMVKKTVNMRVKGAGSGTETEVITRRPKLFERIKKSGDSTLPNRSKFPS